MTNTTIREIGVPVRSVNRAGLYPGWDAKGNPRILGTMSQQAANFFLLVIDPNTGEFRQLPAEVPESNYTTACFVSRSGRLYIGAAHSGRLYCYDPHSEDLLDLGAINPEKAIYPCRIDEDSKGMVWISSYGTADLTRFDPDAGEFTHFGRMDEIDMYAYCHVNTDDTVACLITQTRPHVAVLDPRTGEKRSVGPVTTKGEGTLSLHRGADGLLYIDSSEGKFRIDGMEAVPVDRVVAPEDSSHRLADGTTFRYNDAEQHIHRHIEIVRSDGASHIYALDYDAAGTDIFCLHGGPDGLVYGSSVLPEHFFRYDPASGKMADLGVCSEAVGEAYSMANLDGRIYISSYPGARVSEYDPSQAYDYGSGPDSNPRELGRIDDISYRPRSTLAGPAGKVWLASIPDYGLWGGPLSWYDPATGEKKAYYRIFGDGSCYTLAWLRKQELIAVGTAIQGGSGTQPKIQRAVLFLFDYTTEEKVWEGSTEGRVTAFTALITAPDGRLFGILRGDEGEKIFVFDPDTRQFSHTVLSPEGGTVDNGLQTGPDGLIYGLTRLCVYRVDPTTLSVEEVVSFDEPLRGHAAAGPIIDGEIYFASGHRLMAGRIL